MQSCRKFSQPFALCLTGALLASCGSSEPLALQFPPSPGAAISQRFVTPADEGLLGNQTSYSATCYGTIGELVTFSASGMASGPYPGPFTVHGSFWIACGSIFGNTNSFREKFNVTVAGRRTKHLTGRLSAYSVGYECYIGCFVSGDVAYTADLYVARKLRQSFSGTAYVDRAGRGGVNETLKGL